MDESARLQRLREICLGLPETTERLSHGEPTWFIRDRKSFVTFSNRHHGTAYGFWCAAPFGAQDAMMAAQPARFFRPPYFGHRGWLGVSLEQEDTDWDEVEQIVRDAYRVIAPPKLAALA